MRHVRHLMKAEIEVAETPLILHFTRAFLADDFKGTKLHGPSSQTNYANGTRCNSDNHSSLTGANCYISSISRSDMNKERIQSEVSHLPPPNTVDNKPQSSESKKSTSRSRKYYSSISHTLRVLNSPDSSSSDSDNENVLNGNTQTIKSSKVYEKSPSPPTSRLEKIDSMSVDELNAALRRLGLPTSFGPEEKKNYHEKSRPKRCNGRDYSYYADVEYDKEVTAAIQLLKLQAGRPHRGNMIPRHKRKSSTPPSFLHCCSFNNSAPTLHRSSSEHNLTGYYSGLFTSVCNILELACTFGYTRNVILTVCDLTIPISFISEAFNLEAFLYRCRTYLRQQTRLPPPPVNNRLQSNNNSAKQFNGFPRPQSVNEDMDKYWAQRFRLFSRYNEGIHLDRDGLFSATPEVIAYHQAKRIHAALVNGDVDDVGKHKVLDLCAGTGSNSIQLALLGFHVVAVEFDQSRIAMAAHNATIYGVRSRIEFVQADLFEWAHEQLCHSSYAPNGAKRRPPFAAAFMSAPWGGPDYLRQDVFDLHTIQFSADPSGNGFWRSVQLASLLSGGNLVLFIPRNSNISQMIDLGNCIYGSLLPGDYKRELEVEMDVINCKSKAISIYSGALCISQSASYAIVRNHFYRSSVSVTNDQELLSTPSDTEDYWSLSDLSDTDLTDSDYQTAFEWES